MKDLLFLTTNDVVKIDTKQAMYLQKGDVALVRSTNVAEYRDHFMLVTGPIVKKEHGMRPKVDVYRAEDGDSMLLDIIATGHEMAVILKLKDPAKMKFMEYANSGKIKFISHD